MSAHPPKELQEVDKAVLGEKSWTLRRNLLIAGLAGLLIALIATPFSTHTWDRFAFAYLVAFCFALAITLGSLFFVMVTTVFRAGWCVVFRRIPENLAANMPTIGILSIPILITVLLNNGSLYPWTGTNAEGQTAHYVGKKEANKNELALLPGDEYEKDDNKKSKADGEHPAKDIPFLRLAAAAPASTATPSEGHDDHHGEDKDHSEAHHDDEHQGDAHGKAEHADAHGAGHHGDSHHGDGHGDGHHADGHHGDHHAWTHTADHWPDHNHALPYYVYKKGSWYTPVYFVGRIIFYLIVWSALGIFYWKRSVAQDRDGDVAHTHKREWWAPLALTTFALTLTLGIFDLLMSLDPVWYSTMFGVYFFAGAFTSAICTMIVTIMLGQRYGYFPSVTTEHLHDLAKLLFAFVFFWGYVGYSQFMLIWYASFPETTYWFEIRGFTSVSANAVQDAPPSFGSGWSVIGWTLLFGHLLLPFAILLSRHVKRNRVVLFTMACWMLTLCYIDIFWLAMPALMSPEIYFGLPEIGCVVFCICIMLAEALRRASSVSLTAHRDPRMHESLALDTSAWAPLYLKH
ncbi:MAG: hypothetical protein AAGH99_03440 [Planctomycetota bacterium]